MANNILVDWMNKKKNEKLNNVQSNVLKKSSTNASNITTPNLPKPTISQTGLNLQKAQQPVQTRLNNLNNQTFPSINQGPMMNGQPMTQDSLKSRFIGLQGNNNLPSTDLGGNIIQANVDKKKKEEFDRRANKPVLNIPTKKSEIEQFNKKQSDSYRTNENVIKDFHYDVRNSNGTLTKERISQHYPEFAGKEDIALMLQSDLLPLVQNNEFADMKKLAEIYPELLPKQKKVGDQILKDQEKEGQQIKDLAKKAEKTLSRYNVLSKNGEKYMQDVWQVGNFVDTIRKDYKLPGNPSDLDIINFGKENIPELKAILDDMEMLKSNYNLTERDRDIILNNGFDIGEWLYQAGADIQNFTQNNKLGDYLDRNSSTWERQLSNLGINGSSANTIANLPKKAVNTAEIPVNMFGSLTSGVGKVGIATERIATQQNRNEDGTTDTNGIVQDVIKGGGGALDTAFNTVMAIPTAVFHLAEETDAGSAAIDGTLGKMQRELDNLQSGKTTNSDNAFTQWYNGLDDEAKADLLNEEIMAIFHSVHKGGGNVKKLGKFEIDSAKNAINDVIRQKYSIESNSASFKAKVEQGLADGTMKVTDDGKLTDKDGNNIGKVKVHKIKTKDKIKYVVDKVISDNRAARNAKSLGELDPNALPDNRTFTEKAGEKAYNAGVKTREIYDSVKGGVDTVKEGIQDINVGGAVKGTAEAVGKGVKATSDLYNKGKNVVTQGKNKVTNAVKENVVEPFKKGYEGVKETVNENIVEPYNKGRGKTNEFNKKTVNQGQQLQESNSTSEINNKVNGDNYTQKNTNSKKLNKVQLKLLQNNNRMNPKSIDTFKEWYGEDYGQYMYDRGFTKTADGGNLDDMENYKNSLLSQKRATLNKIEGTYQDISLQDMAEHLVEKATTVRNRKLLKEAQELQNKHNETGLTMPEADRLRTLFQQNVKMGFHQDIPADARERAKNEYMAVKEFLDDVGRKNGFDDLDNINREIQKTQHIIKGIESKLNRESANNAYTLTDYILMAEAFTSPQTAAVFTAKQVLKNPKVRSAGLNVAVGGRENAKNRVTAGSREKTNENVESIAGAKRKQKEMGLSENPALPESIKLRNVIEIDKRKPTDTTPPTENTPTEKAEETAPKKKSESKPKNKVTSKKSEVTEKKTEVKEEKKAEQPKAKKENKKLTIEERNAEFEKSVDEDKLNEIREYAKENGKLDIVPIGIRKTLQLKNHGVMLSKAEIEILEKEGLLKGAEQPKEETKTESNIATRTAEDMKGFTEEEIKNEEGTVKDFDESKLSADEKKTYDIIKDKGFTIEKEIDNPDSINKIGEKIYVIRNDNTGKIYEISGGLGYEDYISVEYNPLLGHMTKGKDIGVILDEINDLTKGEQPKNAVTSQKTAVTTKQEPKQEDKSGGNAFGLKEQKGSSRINNFTNVVKKIVDKYGDKIEEESGVSQLRIELGEPYQPLDIEYYPGRKQIIVSHPRVYGSDIIDDPGIRFSITNEGKLKPIGVRLAFMEQQGFMNRAPIKETDELLHTRAVNLEDQYLGERNIDEDTGVMKEEKSESTPTEEVKEVKDIKSVDDLGLNKNEFKNRPGLSDQTERYGKVGNNNVIIRDTGDNEYTLIVGKGGEIKELPQNYHGLKGQTDSYHFQGLTFDELKNNLQKAMNGDHFDGMSTYKGKTITDREGKKQVMVEFGKWEDVPNREGKTKNVVTEKAGVTTKSEPKKQIKETQNTGESDMTSNANIINNIKSFDDLKDLLKPTKAGAVSDWEYEGKLNGVKTKVWNYGDTIFVKYGEGQGPAQARIDIADADHIDQLKELLSEINNDGEILESNRSNPFSPKEEKTETKSDLTSKKSNVTAQPREIDNSSITGRFRNLTLQDYKEMQKYQGVENQLINGDEQGYILGKIKNQLLDEENPLIEGAEIDESELYPVNYDDLKELVDKKKEIQDAERKLMKKNDDNLSQQIEDLRYGYDNEMLPNLGIYGVEDVDTAVNIIESTMSEAHFQFLKDKEGIKPLVEKYGNYWEQGKSVDKKENTNIIGKNNSLTTNNNNNGQKLGTNEQGVGQSNGGTRGELRNEVSNMQSVESNETGLQRPSDTNGNGKLNTSREQADISGNGLTTGPESSKLTVGQQRKINEDSRNILEKHNFSTNRSDYTPEELETLFKYEGNGGLAKAGDENVKGTRYEFYTPKNAVSALQRGIQKYSDSPINSVEDPTAGKGNMLDGYGDNIDKYMYEISPVSGTIAKLRFPEAKVGIGEKDGDFQRRYLNYQGQKAYDTPRDGGHNVDAVLLNPPFGKRITIKDEPQIKSLEDYFTKRSIEHDLKDGGMVGLLMPSRWLKASDSYTKKWLDGHTQIVDAYRLPAGVFSYTDVGTDLIILKKVSGADNKGGFIDDNYFKENPNKVLGVEKERTGRHGMETYIEGDPKVIDTLWQDTDIVPSQMNAVTDTTNKAAITSKKAVENKPKNLVTNPPKEDAKFTPTEKTTTTEKPKAEKKPTTRKSKNAKQTISKGDKTDIGTYTVNGNEKAYTYQDATDADGFIDRSKLSISPKEVAEGVDLLNYIDGRIQTDYLYYSGDIYAKLKQLEKDKPQMSDAQYKKQKEGLQAILPSKLSVRDITWSPTDKLLLSEMTDELETRRDSTTREDVTEPITIKDSFKKRIRKLGSEQFEGTDTNKWKIMDYVDGKRWSSERITQRYSETDEEFEMRKKAKKAEEEQKKQATKERTRTFFNDFIKEHLSPEIQNKITESYNTRLRAVVKPDYKNMPLSVKNMSATFHGKPLKIDPVQIEGINAMLSKGTMLIAHGVGYGKTLEGVVATIASVQKGWTKKPLFIVPKGTREDWIKTIHDLFPNQEIVDLGGLTVDDIKRLKRDLGNDVNNWIKDGQVAIITHNGFDNRINFKKESQNSLEGDLRDVMDNDNNTARQEDSLAENIQNIAETVNAKKDTKKLKGIKATLSDKYGDKLLEELDKELENMNEIEFVENFVSKTEGMFKEEELRKDAHDMYETKPIYIEDLGIDHITVDEVHNYKNIFTSAKSNYKKGEGPEEVNPYGKISGSSSARGRKMFATSQYILKNNGGRGVFSLSATPFNNQPIEVYNMLSLHAYNRLVEKGIQNINSFFDYFANFRSEWISNPLKKGGGEFGEVMKDFNNLPEMQRLVGEYIDYVGDNPNLVRPEKRMKKVILTPSDMQREIQQRLQKEEKRLNANGEGDSVLPIYNDMRLNIISPYLTSYGKLYNTPTWQEFIESSPKLKFAVDTIKALRDEGQNDGVFIYMPLGVEYHSLLKEAIENIVGRDKVKVGIINGGTTGTETVDGEKVEKRIAIADRFRKGELNVLIGGRNTSEGINLQDNGFITINTLIGWNPTEITQLNGRIHRQGNLRDHVIELLPLLTDGADIMMMQKYDEKANRINNIFESQGRTFNLEELDPEEEKMALNTDPVRKAELSIDMDKKRIQRDIQKLSGQNGTLREVIQKMPKEETIKEQEEMISKAQEELKGINEGMKALSPDSTAYRTLESQRDYTERKIKGEKERLKALEKDKARAEARMQSYSIDSIEGVNQRIAENDAKLDDLIEQEKNLQNELNERIDKYTKEQKEWEANMKTSKEYLEELKEDFRSKKIFGDREELKQHLEEQKKQKEEKKNKVTGNGKNKITNG